MSYFIINMHCQSLNQTYNGIEISLDEEEWLTGPGFKSDL